MRCLARAACWLTLAFGVAAPSTARAWYFPEHAEFARLALQDSGTPFTRRVLAEIVASAAADGLMLCKGTPLPFNRVALERDDIATCVPYSTLAALAGDHASTTGDLRDALTQGMFRPWPNSNVQLARLLTGAAVVTWQNYFANTPSAELHVWTGEAIDGGSSDSTIGQTLQGRNFIARLDIELLALDPKYVSRAAGSKSHFHNAGLPLHQVLDNMVAGDLDNALAQMLVHHSRSLELAVRARSATGSSRNAMLSEALLEHAFSLHFLGDAFAAGHIATDPAFSVSERRKQRHDYFNRQGLQVTYALDAGNCGRDVNEQDKAAAQHPRAASTLMYPRPSRCWVAHGDGYATMADRVHVDDAVARVQTEFALAAWQGDCKHTADCRDAVRFLGFTAPTAEELAAENKPKPTQAPRAATAGGAGAPGSAGSAASLGGAPSTADSAAAAGGATSDTQAQDQDLPRWTPYTDKLSTIMSKDQRVYTSKAQPVGQDPVITHTLPTLDALETELAWLGVTPLAPPRSAGEPGAQPFTHDADWLGCPLKDRELGKCDYDPDAATGGAALWRAILAVWPTATASPETLAGSDSGADGSSLQINFGVGAGCVHPFLCRDGVVVGAAGTVGYAYRLAGLFPHRRALAVAELNVGPAFIARVGGAGDDGKSQRVLGAVITELRAPVTTLLVYLTGYAWRTRVPVSLVGNDFAIGLFGARAIWQPEGSRFGLRGWEVEVLNYRLNSADVPDPASVSAAQDTELRLHVGYANFDSSMKDISNGSIMFDVDVASGYYRFF
jgi:hypothetical protein